MEPGKGNCETCKRLIRLCGNLDYFPADPEVRLVLIERLHYLARDHQHAKAMIDRWLETQTIAPKVANLVSLAAEVRNVDDELPGGCAVCGGGYWVVVDGLAKRCTCARGEALRQMARRAAERENTHGR
ncbi:MAG TPA: hypothetical protein VKV17_16570 [Bryobacteraceae bacterium]|nr:hypothetical protein [Bryobacteraceae bacterium]